MTASDFPGARLKALVREGDSVRRGASVLCDRRRPTLRWSAPAAGRIAAIHRGERRRLLAIEIELDAPDDEGGPVSFATSDLARSERDPERLRELLVESGLWTVLRTRPFSHVPVPGGRAADAIFVTAMDSHPLAADPQEVLRGKEEPFERGLIALASLTEGEVLVCQAPGAEIPVGRAPARVEEFAGPHPAGTVGLHIHTLRPVDRGHSVWHLGYQDVVRIGHLLATGEVDGSVVVSLAGPSVHSPRLVRTLRGAALSDLVAGELAPGEHRVISGSVLSGRAAQGRDGDFLGSYDRQVTVVPEGGERDFLWWLRPGLGRYSTLPVFLSAFARRGRALTFTTSTHGARRAMVPIGQYERIMPMDLLPTHLLRALVAGDVEWAEQLGCLELDEEDLSLCSFVCPGKVEYGPYLRHVLEDIAREAA